MREGTYVGDVDNSCRLKKCNGVFTQLLESPVIVCAFCRRNRVSNEKEAFRASLLQSLPSSLPLVLPG